MGENIILIFLLIICTSIVNKKWGTFLCFIFLIWLFSFRSNEIPDTEMYQWMYDDPISRIGYNEIGYLFIGYIFKTITNAEFIVYYLVLVWISCLLWYYGSRRLLPNIEHRGMLLLIFISFFGFLYMGVLIRNCISEMLVLCGISMLLTTKGKRKYLLFVAFVILGAFIHKSVVFFLLLIPFFRIKIPTRTYYYYYIICVVIWLISGVGLAKNIIGEISKISVFSNYEGYSKSMESSPNMFSLQILISLFVSYCAIKNKGKIQVEYKNIYNYFLKINMVGLLVLSIIWSLPTSYRFYNLFFFFNYLLIYLMIFQNERISSKNKKLFYALSISVTYFFILLHSFPFMLLY